MNRTNIVDLSAKIIDLDRFEFLKKVIGLPAKESIENFLIENGYKDRSAFINTSSIKETFNGTFISRQND